MNLRDLLARSAATPEFRDAVETFLHDGRPSERVHFGPYAPPVKVARTLAQLLVASPELPVERVEIDGASGCEFFRGAMRVVTAEGERRVRFHWDCRWKAIQNGWTDYFGFPDQIRAARECDHDCFRVWEASPVPELLAEA